MNNLVSRIVENKPKDDNHEAITLYYYRTTAFFHLRTTTHDSMVQMNKHEMEKKEC